MPCLYRSFFYYRRRSRAAGGAHCFLRRDSQKEQTARVCSQWCRTFLLRGCSSSVGDNRLCPGVQVPCCSLILHHHPPRHVVWHVDELVRNRRRRLRADCIGRRLFPRLRPQEDQAAHCETLWTSDTRGQNHVSQPRLSSSLPLGLDSAQRSRVSTCVLGTLTVFAMQKSLF